MVTTQKRQVLSEAGVLEFERPRALGIFLLRKNFDLVARKINQRGRGIPGASERVFHLCRHCREVRQKILVAAMAAVIRLPGWRRQKFFNKRDVEVEQKGSVEQQRVASSSLGVAGEFQPVNREVRVTADSDFCFMLSAF